MIIRRVYCHGKLPQKEDGYFEIERIYSRRFAVHCILVFILLSPNRTEPYGNLLTQNSQKEGEIPITISTKYAVDLNDFEQAAEAKFPNLNLIQVGNYTVNYSDEYAEQLANNDLTYYRNLAPE